MSGGCSALGVRAGGPGTQLAIRVTLRARSFACLAGMRPLPQSFPKASVQLIRIRKHSFTVNDLWRLGPISLR